MAGHRAAVANKPVAPRAAGPTSSSTTGAKSVVYIAGTFDTKGRELEFMRERIVDLGVASRTVDLSTSSAPSSADVSSQTVAAHHPQGATAVFTGDRGTSVGAMAVAFEHYLLAQDDVGGLLAAGGSGGTALATPAMRALPIGIPKLMLSTVASGDVRPYVGGSDICMMYSVTDVQGLNAISQRVMANAAHAVAGMVANRPPVATTRPALGLTMFGVTTPCVQAVTDALYGRYDCLVFHATGTGGQSMEKLADSGWLVGVIDTTTTEVADEIAGGIFSAGPGRFDAIVRSRLPYVGSCGGLDMVNFAGIETLPARYKGRLVYEHNANVTLMRTTAEECAAAGRFIAAKLNRMAGPVRFFLPLGGLSMLDAPGGAFWDPKADQALFDAIEADFVPAPNRQLVRSPLHLNDPAFAALIVAAFESIAT